MKNLIKVLLTFLGVCILVCCIVEEVDGIGRFAMIFFGSLFSVIGSFIPFEKKSR